MIPSAPALAPASVIGSQPIAGNGVLDSALEKRATAAAQVVVPAAPGSTGQPTRFATGVPEGATISQTKAVSLNPVAGTSAPAKVPEIPKGLPWGKSEVVAQASAPGGNMVKMTYVTDGRQPAKVSKVGDGDGVTAKYADGSSVTCRLDQINAPEVGKPAWTTKNGKQMNASPDQSFGRESQKNLENLILNKEVTVKITKAEKGRKFCEVEFQGKNVEINQLEAGMAWVYDRYVSAKNKESYNAIEAKAKSQRAGLWKELNPVDPEVFAHQFN